MINMSYIDERKWLFYLKFICVILAEFAIFWRKISEICILCVTWYCYVRLHLCKQHLSQTLLYPWIFRHFSLEPNSSTPKSHAWMSPIRNSLHPEAPLRAYKGARLAQSPSSAQPFLEPNLFTANHLSYITSSNSLV